MQEFAKVSVELINVSTQNVYRINKTRGLFSDVCGVMLDAASVHMEEIGNLNTKEALTFTENLIHQTKKNPNPEVLLFDVKYNGYPSYYRRSAINTVNGHIKSYLSNLENWKESHSEASHNGTSHKAKQPKLGRLDNACPAMYRHQMYEMDGPTIELKLMSGKTWKWFKFKMCNADYKYFKEKSAIGEVLSPLLVVKFGKFYLDFPIKYSCELPKMKKLRDRKVMAVDLGINTPAVCSLVDYNGTVLGRKFVSIPSEKAELFRLLNRQKRMQRESGNSSTKLWTKIDGIKIDYSRQIAHKIAMQAIEWDADVIVFECLKGFNRRMKKSERVQHWAKRHIQDLVLGMAHRNGIRIAFINPKNSSKLAFDGSGEVRRDKSNYSVCTFSSGKRYNCDLSASYNIAARYFQRELLKSLDESSECQLKAKVPELCKRTRCTLASYRELLRLVTAPDKKCA